MCSRGSSWALSFRHMLGSIQAAARQNCTTQFLRTISITHKIHSQLFVMGVFCQSPQACQDDFQHLLSSRVEWTDVGSYNQLGMSHPFNGTQSRQDCTHKMKGTQTNNFQLHSFGRWLVVISPMQKLVEYQQSQFRQKPHHECSQVTIDSLLLLCRGWSQKRDQPPNLALQLVEWKVTSSSPFLQHWSDSTPHCLAHEKLHGLCRDTNCSTHHSNSSSKSWCTDTSEIWDTVIKWLPYATASSHFIQHAAITKVAMQHSNHIFENIKHVQTIV